MLTDSDWAEIFRQAGGNGVTSLLYHRLRRHRPLVPIPPVALEHLWDASVRSAAQSLRLGRELAQVLAALRHHRVPVVVLKGAHLGQLVYPSAALRTMCDIDVLVGREDLTRAAAILSGLGYALQYYNVEEVDYTQHHHLRPMARPDGVRVEIHWAIAQPALPFAIDVKGLWERARPAEIAGAEVLVLSPEDLLLHLCLHASFTHGFRVGLRACWDILETVNHYGQAIDWDLVVRRAQAWGIGRYVYLTLRLVRDLLGAGIPPTAVAALEPPGFPSEVVAWATTCIFMPESDELVTASLARLSTSRPIGASLPCYDTSCIHPGLSWLASTTSRSTPGGSTSTIRCGGRTSCGGTGATPGGCGAVIIARGANSVPYPNARPWPTGSGSRRRRRRHAGGWRTGEPGRYLRSALT